jgi:hypothetical protein
MSYIPEDQGRMLKSARALKVYFENKLKTPLELLSEEPSAREPGDVAFDDSMRAIGLWGLRSQKPLEDRQVSEVLEMFHAILGALRSLEEQRQDLESLQREMEKTYSGLPSNVIPMRRRESPQGHAAGPRWTIRRDCLVEAKSIGEAHKMATELHAHSFRYAFLEFRDLDSKQRQWIPDLLGLGCLTIFVPDLLQLSLHEQKVLLELTGFNSENRPLLMVGTTLPYAELRSTPGVHLDFLAEISRVYIKLTRPFQEYKDQGLIHYFLDSLSENQPTI